VFGLEAQGNWADLTGSTANQTIAGALVRSKLDAFGLFTGQVGYAWNNALLYVKGGAAVTSDRYRTFSAAGALTSSSSDDTRWGGTVGVGLEYGFAPNWSAALEYNHLFIANSSVTFPNTATGGVVSADRLHGDADLVSVHVNYRWGGPVVAKY
jgi:outer membrane immunogenic protein